MSSGPPSGSTTTLARCPQRAGVLFSSNDDSPALKRFIKPLTELDITGKLGGDSSEVHRSNDEDHDLLACIGGLVCWHGAANSHQSSFPGRSASAGHGPFRRASNGSGIGARIDAQLRCPR